MVKSFFNTTIVNLVGKFIVVASGVFFARVLGAEQYGLYGYTISTVALLTLPVVAGLPNLLIREISKSHSSNNWSYISGIITWSRLNVILISTFIVAFFYIINHYFTPPR